MCLVRKSSLFEQDIKTIADNARHLILAPSLDRIARSIIPPSELSINDPLGTTSASATNHNQMLPNLIAFLIQRRVAWERFFNFIQLKVAAGIREPLNDGVIRAVINKFTRDLTNMFGSDEEMRSDRSAQI